jgi:hypothetical protein
MKKTLCYIGVAALLVFQGGLVWSASQLFTLSATITAMTGSSIGVNSVSSATSVWTPVTGTGLSFDPMTTQTFTVGSVTSTAFLPNHYFAIDIAGTGGAGTPSTVVTYADVSSPFGSTADQKLGNRGTVSFKSVKYISPTNTPEFSIPAHPIKLLKNVVGESITSAQVIAAGGTWLRLYVGLNDGNPAGTFPSGIPFSPSDPAGPYTGTLQITATP